MSVRADGARDDRARIAARIRALLSKTVDNGCTEAEALSAAALAADLLARHEMTVDEAQVRETPFGEREVDEPDAVGERLWRPAEAIAKLTRCRYWTTGPGINPVRVSFLGLEHEVEIAAYLLAICSRAMRDGADRAERNAALLRPEFRRRRRNAFLDGMSGTLGDRILAMCPPEPKGTGLAVLRNELVDAELKRRGHNIREKPGPRGRELEEGYVEGRQAGERVALDRGVRGPGRDAARIGRGA